MNNVVFIRFLLLEKDFKAVTGSNIKSHVGWKINSIYYKGMNDLVDYCKKNDIDVNWFNVLSIDSIMKRNNTIRLKEHDFHYLQLVKPELFNFGVVAGKTAFRVEMDVVR